MTKLLVTVTGGRPKAFDILQQVMSKQTQKDFTWLVVCDEWTDYKLHPSMQKRIRFVKNENVDPKKSFFSNWTKALEFINDNDEFDKFLVIEDDDYYHKDYVGETEALLDRADLVGWENDAYYFVITRKAMRRHNVGFASLASTAFNRQVLPYFKRCLELCDKANNVYLDQVVWKGVQEERVFPSAPLTMPNGQVVSPPPTIYNATVDEYKGTKLLMDNFTGLDNRKKPDLRWVENKLTLVLQIPELDKKGNIIDEHPRHVGMKEPYHGGRESLSNVSCIQGGGPDMYGDKLRDWIGKDDAKLYLSLFKDPPGRTNTLPFPPLVMIPMGTEQDQN